MSTALSVPARTALAHIEKADKFVKEAGEIRAQFDKVDRLESKAAEHYKAAGLIFSKIKAAHDTSVDGPWKAICQKKCGLSWQRVYELIDIASGGVTLADQRERKLKSSDGYVARRSAERAVARSANQGSVGRPSPKVSACDYDWSNPNPADFGDPSEMYAKQAENHIHEALHLAEAFPLISGRIDPAIITNKQIQAAQKVADAWLNVVSKLKLRAKRKD